MFATDTVAYDDVLVKDLPDLRGDLFPEVVYYFRRIHMPTVGAFENPVKSYLLNISEVSLRLEM